MAIDYLPTIIWDFDGTLAYHKLGYFYETIIKVLDEHEPGHNIGRNELCNLLKGLLPWHKPMESHFNLSDAKDWWKAVEGAFTYSLMELGYKKKCSLKLARLTHEIYIEPANFLLYDDAIDTLAYFNERGWKNIILSNNIPDLPQIVEKIGLSRLIYECISSANIGYEKPNPEAFRYALNVAGNPKHVWMVGDSLETDIIGAQAVNIKAVWVHCPENSNEKYCASNLIDVTNLIF